MHVVSFPQLCETIRDRFSSFVPYADGIFLSICGKFGPTSCMSVLSNGHTAVTQNHITMSFDAQSKTQQASGYNTYTSCLSVNASLYMLSNLSLYFPSSCNYFIHFFFSPP